MRLAVSNTQPEQQAMSNAQRRAQSLRAPASALDVDDWGGVSGDEELVLTIQELM